MQTIKRLTILDYGLFQVNENQRIIGILGYLLQTHDGTNILVDTGFPAKYAINTEKATLEDGLETFGQVLQLTEDNLPKQQLSLCDLKPEDIDILVLTHTHIDHVGAMNDFPQAQMVIGKAERDLPHPLYWNDRSPIQWRDDLTYQCIEADTNLCAGVRLLTTPGHSPGHLSLLVHLPETGTVLLTGDAISRPAEIDEGFASSWDANQAQASANRIMQIAHHEQAMVIYGHDPEQWEQLRKAPNFYK